MNGVLRGFLTCPFLINSVEMAAPFNVVSHPGDTALLACYHDIILQLRVRVKEIVPENKNPNGTQRKWNIHMYNIETTGVRVYCLHCISYITSLDTCLGNIKIIGLPQRHIKESILLLSREMR